MVRKAPDTKKSEGTQAERFKEAARGLGCDENEEHFREKLKQVAQHKPPANPPTPQKKSKTNKPAK